MSRYVDSTEQLVTEIAVRDIQRSACFYRLLGFVLLRDGGELAWENHRLFLAQPSAFHEVDRLESSVVSQFPRANVRVMVPNVDDYWTRANEIGAQIIVSIDDRYYGLRDFIIADPDGFGIRFASKVDNGYGTGSALTR